MEKIHSIRIEQVDNGYIVNVGCKTLVFGEKVELIHELESYINNPKVKEAEYNEKYGWLENTVEESQTECMGNTLAGCMPTPRNLNRT